MHSAGSISIWFFIGVLLTIYGALILGYGIYEYVSGNWAHVVLVQLHAPVWWGAIMLAIGVFYCLRFSPAKKLD
ncbi:MAG TPA: hypothetical protein VGD59_07895 [Acidisarcina sp.]